MKLYARNRRLTTYRRHRQAVQAAEREKNSFVEALEDWDAQNDKTQGFSKGHKLFGHQERVSRVRADISQQHTWDDVVEIIRAAQDEHNQSRVSSRIRRFFGKIADNKAAIEPWFGFIPDGDYTSIACGGIKFILGVSLVCLCDTVTLSRNKEECSLISTNLKGLRSGQESRRQSHGLDR